jgi:hypothetical protein
MAALSELAVAPVHPHSDCMSVVHAAGQPIRAQLDQRLRYAGLRRVASRRPGHVHVIAASHTPAHRSDAVISALPDAERRIAWASKHVDSHVKTTLEMHPAPPGQMDQDFAWHLQRVRHAARAIAATLKCFEPLKFERRSNPVAHRERKQMRSRWHSWRTEGSTWRCETCLRTSDATNPDELSMSGCTGSPKVLKSISRQNFLGHRIQCCDIDGGQLFFCVVCGAWALRKCVNVA